MILGILFVIIGVLVLFRNLGLIVLPTNAWQIIYPLVVIVLGIYLMMGIRRGRHYRDLMMKKWFKSNNQE